MNLGNILLHDLVAQAGQLRDGPAFFNFMNKRRFQFLRRLDGHLALDGGIAALGGKYN